MPNKAGFAVRKSFKGQKDFDTTYKDVQLVKRLVPLGPADDKGNIPYTEEVREVITETPIKEVIAKSDGEAGLEAFLKPYQATGTTPPEVIVTPNVDDFTQFDAVGDLRASGEVERLFNSLPEDLKAAYGTPENLLKKMNDQVLADYVASKVYKPEEKIPEKEEGEK